MTLSHTNSSGVDIFVVDDDPVEAELLPYRFRNSRYAPRLRFAHTLAGCAALSRPPAPDLVICDHRFPPHDDFRVTAPALRDFGYEGPILLATSCLIGPEFNDYAEYGVCGIVDKSDLDGAFLDRFLEKARPATST